MNKHWLLTLLRIKTPPTDKERLQLEEAKTRNIEASIQASDAMRDLLTITLQANQDRTELPK
jgi:hypothetical protein